MFIFFLSIRWVFINVKKNKAQFKEMRGYNFWDQVINDCTVHLAVDVN